MECAQDLVEGLRDELSLRNSQTDEDSSKGDSQHDAIPEVVKQHVSDLIESTTQVSCNSGPYVLLLGGNSRQYSWLLHTQVFHIVATVAAHTGRKPPTANFAITPPLAPITPDQSDASSASSGVDPWLSGRPARKARNNTMRL